MAVGIAAALTAAWAVWGRGPRGPDVLLIVMDTTRADRCSFIDPGARPTTPRLAELAKESVVFTDTWAPAPHTCPSHATLFTGLQTRRHGLSEATRLYLDESHVTLAEMLREEGWRTAAWSNNPNVADQFQLLQGFEVRHELFKPPLPVYPTAKETHERALKWIKERHAAGERWFAFINDMEPHVEYTPPPEFQARFLAPPGEPYTQQEITLARRWAFPVSLGYMLGQVEITDRQFKLLSDLYDAEIATLDAQIGALIDALRETGRLDDTLVIIVGDHGESFGEHGIAEHGLAVYRNLLHVPLLVRYPGKFDGGKRIDAVARLEDILPTVLEICGVEAPAPIDGAGGYDGATLSELLRPAAQPRIALGAFEPSPRFEQMARRLFRGADYSLFGVDFRSVYDGRHHLIDRSDGRRELYDVKADPGETNNLAAREPDAVERLSKHVRR